MRVQGCLNHRINPKAKEDFVEVGSVESGSAPAAPSRVAGASSFSRSASGLIRVAGSWDVLTLWDPASGRMTGVLEGHTRFPEAVAFSRDGSRIASGPSLCSAARSLSPESSCS